MDLSVLLSNISQDDACPQLGRRIAPTVRWWNHLSRTILVDGCIPRTVPNRLLLPRIAAILPFPLVRQSKYFAADVTGAELEWKQLLEQLHYRSIFFKLYSALWP